MQKRYVLLLVASTLVTLNSCVKYVLCIRGNGITETEIRRTGSFRRIENLTGIDVVYKIADTTGITVTADENLLEYIVTGTNNNTLEISTRDGNTCLDFDIKPLITITSPGLESVFVSGSGAFFADEISGEDVAIKMSGSGYITVDNVTSTVLTVTLSGSGNIKIKNCISVSSDVFLSGSGNIDLAGESVSSDLTVSGSGEINAENWMLGSADITISGSGDIFTNIEHSLKALISGSGNIYLKGDPIITKTISGSGRIIKYK